MGGFYSYPTFYTAYNETEKPLIHYRRKEKMLVTLWCVIGGLFIFLMSIYVIFLISLVVAYVYNKISGTLESVEDDLFMAIGCMELEYSLNEHTKMNFLKYTLENVFRFPFIVWENL